MKNPLHDLEQRARVALSDVVEHLRMKAPDHADALDLREGGRLINVLWTLADGICITEVTDDSVLDDEPGYVVHSVVPSRSRSARFAEVTSVGPPISHWLGLFHATATAVTSGSLHLACNRRGLPVSDGRASRCGRGVVGGECVA